VSSAKGGIKKKAKETKATKAQKAAPLTLKVGDVVEVRPDAAGTAAERARHIAALRRFSTCMLEI
jgi:D-serine deaminase-like pyridoxal phosphate-dependent protein